MGWLQGLRFRNEQQIKESREHAISTVANACAYKPSLIDTEDKIVTEEKSPSPLIQEVIPSRLNVEQGTHVPNELEALLVATFERPQRCNNNLAGDEVKQRTLPSWPILDESVDDRDLPHIPKEEIVAKKLPAGQNGLKSEAHLECLWIVVENVVYDCSNFVYDHPGGMQVILSFVGEDCTWQFWRFHSRNIMHQYGRGLRIGRTADVQNRFEEPSKYVGLRRLGHDDY